VVAKLKSKISFGTYSNNYLALPLYAKVHDWKFFTRPNADICYREFTSIGTDNAFEGMINNRTHV